MFVRLAAIAAAAALALAAPAAAVTSWVVLASGTTNAGAGPPGNTLTGVPFANLPVLAAFVVTSAGNPVTLPPIGGTGSATRYDQSVLDLVIQVGPWTIGRTAASTRSVFVIDNASNPMNPALRTDQFSMSDGFSFVGSSFFPHLTTDAPLADGVFLSSFKFARSHTLSGMEPDFIIGSGFPDLLGIYAPAGPDTRGFTFNFRQGNPTSPAEHAALPQVTFGVIGLEFAAFELGSAIPEPGTWALLVAGFAMAGVAARRRRSAIAS